MGMYVRCPIDEEDTVNPRLYIVGQIEDLNTKKNLLTVIVYDPDGMRRFWETIPRKKQFETDDVRHCKLLDRSIVRVRGKEWKSQIVCYSHTDKEGYYHYFLSVHNNGEIETKVISEYFLEVSFTRADPNPLWQMSQYEFHNPFWYKRRDMVIGSLHMLRNATYGFDTLVGSRALLLPHQVDSIVRAISDSQCRFMLADEVGLGKTIEACVIMKGLKEKQGSLRTLVIAPSSLVYQWQNELAYKFWLEFPVWKQDMDICGDLILPLENMADRNSVTEVLTEEWDLCIVDETHRLLNMPEEYKSIYELSKKVPNLLLLSATPIQQRQEEYHNLLCLLAPSRYGKMRKDEFCLLLDKQRYLRERVHRMVRDLEFFYEDELASEFKTELEEIADKLGDVTVCNLVSSIDTDADDQGLKTIQLALAYISENYQVERRILRHRRTELKDRMPERQLEKLIYEMKGSEYGYYERDTYEALLEYLIELRGSFSDDEIITRFVKLCLSAMFSSPWALSTIIKKRLWKVNAGPVYVKSRGISDEIIFAFPGLEWEVPYLDTINQLCSKWLTATKDELERVQEHYDNPDLINGRLALVIDYLLSCSDKDKFVVFSLFPETLTVLSETLSSQCGEEAVTTFYVGMGTEDLQNSADKFQSNPKCKYILCDALGGEGRNFQIAKEVIHVDLPWSPTDLEQRIGRLDRIGRESEVLSVVFSSEQTLENDLYNLWNEGLRIFEESLSGVEIALGDIEQLISQALCDDLRYGLGDILDVMKDQAETMRKMVDQERYYDMARQLDYRVEDQLNRLIKRFDTNEGQDLYNTMMAWSTSAGLNSEKYGPIVIFRPETLSFAAMKNALFVPPDLSQAHSRKRNKGVQELKGTFSRRTAIQREDLIFYSPGEPFFDAIVSNAEECYRGRSCALAHPWNYPHNWRGLIYSWTACIDPVPLLKMNANLEHLSLARGYVPLQQFTTFEGLSDEDNEIDDKLLQDWLFHFSGKKDNKLAHLGQRNRKSDFLSISTKYETSNLDWFKQQFPDREWKQILDKSLKHSQLQVLEEVRKYSDGVIAESDFAQQLAGFKAANLYYGTSDNNNREENKREQIYRALVEGINNPKLRLESISFIWLVGTNDEN